MFNAIVQPAGGGVTAPTLESGLTLDETESAQDFDLVNNDASNPSAVDLSFSANILKAAAFDSGTAESPSYVMEASETRTISLIRGSGAPTVVGTDLDCTVTALLADGNTATQSVNVEALNLDFAQTLRAIAIPTLEYKFDTLSNTGSLSPSFASTLNGGMTQTASTARTNLVGYAEALAVGDYQKISSFAMTNWCRVASGRSWVFCWSNQNTVGSTYISVADATSSGGASGPGWITRSGSGYRSTYRTSSSSAFDFEAAIGTHSSGGSATTLTTTSGRLNLLVVSYDGSDLTYRWKQTGDSAGHTYYVKSESAQTSTATKTFYLSGFTSASANDVRLYNVSVIDAQISGSNFDDLAASVGL